MGLYLNPPDKAIVLCVDEKSQIQALDRTQPALPHEDGPGGDDDPRLQAQRHDHAVRRARTCWTGRSSASACPPPPPGVPRVPAPARPGYPPGSTAPHRRQLRDPQAIRRSRAWLAKHPRFILHFTPTSSSWLNLVERWFRELTTKRIRRGVFRSVPDLIAAIEEYLADHNEEPQPFVWTASADAILAKVSRCRAILETVH